MKIKYRIKLAILKLYFRAFVEHYIKYKYMACNVQYHNILILIPLFRSYISHTACKYSCSTCTYSV